MLRPLISNCFISCVTFSWPWGTFFASLAMEIRPSFRPKGTSQNGPPTIMVVSLAAATRISAQETVLGHFLSTSDFISSMMLKPRRVLLTSADLSLP